MRRVVASVLLGALMAASAPAAEKLTDEQRIEILRGLMAEYATMKVLLPRARKPLRVDPKGAIDKKEWDAATREQGPAARVGDLVQITRVSFDDKELVFEINGGAKGKKKWYERVEVGVGNRTTPIGQQQGNGQAIGTYVALVFPDKLPPLTAADIKKMLQPVMDFEKRTATEQFVQTLPPEVQKAIEEQKVIEGMDRDQVILSVGKPRHKTRETKDGVELEDWIYGQAPGKVTFVTFQSNKVVKVKETYAGLGGATSAPIATP